ncbi:MAG TPA: hypothetical protein VJ726_12155, partial [Candidatus Limnocylindria bacterium]|nr:hypothetical protein [Candidatus Limnocylindria bacterium]
ARGRLWQAEYMVSAMRDQALALACLRHGEDAREGRGLDMLPAEVRDRFASALMRDLTVDEIGRAFRAVTDLALEETRHVDAVLERRIEPVMTALAASWATPSRSPGPL